MGEIFEKSKIIADLIEGMLSPFSMAVMDSLLAFQRERGTTGDMLEMGVYHGKSAAILAGRLSPAERLHLYDIANYFDRDALAKTGARISFNVSDTRHLKKRHFRDLKRAVRFCHVDASHMFEPTMHEMAIADFLLSDEGILCLDDYTNLNYSQILAAAFKYLFTKRTNLVMFLVTDEKAYLCRRSSFPRYARFVLDDIIKQMDERGVRGTCLARTDDTPEYGAFYLRNKNPNEADDFYGGETYRHFYQIRDHSSPRSRVKKTVRKVLARLPVKFK